MAATASVQLTARNQQQQDCCDASAASIHDFIDSNSMVLGGKIGAFRINFSKNLKRF